MGSPIRDAHDILALLNAVLLPKEVSVIHCRGHQKGEDKIAKGNNVADKAAKWAAMQKYTAGPVRPVLWEGTLLLQEREYQSEEGKQAKDTSWITCGWWVSLEGKLWLPETLQWKILKTLHHLYHLGLDNTLVLVNKMFGGTKLRNTAQQVVQGCETCQK
jgi:hypothetical protein